MNDKILILAAGNSSRLGKNKQFLTLNGVSLLNRTIETCQMSSLGQVLVILGFEAEKARNEVQSPDVELLINPNWQNGLGESIATGIKALDHTVDGAYIVLSDQINLDVHTLSKLKKKSIEFPNAIIASKYGEEFGAPCYFPSIYFDALRECGGKKGAKKVLLENIENVKFIDFENGDVDIDTPEDLKLLD